MKLRNTIFFFVIFSIVFSIPIFAQELPQEKNFTPAKIKKKNIPNMQFVGLQSGYFQLDVSILPLIPFPNTRFFGISAEINYTALWQFGKFFSVGPDVFLSYMGARNLQKTRRYFDMAIHVLNVGIGPAFQFSLHRTIDFYVRTNFALGASFLETVIYTVYPPVFLLRILPGFSFNITSKFALTLEGGYIGFFLFTDQKGTSYTFHSGEVSLGMRAKF